MSGNNNDELVFEWDSLKNEQNIIKHGIDFDTASEIFYDNNRIDRIDVKHSSVYEIRRKTIGIVGDVLLYVVYTLRFDRIRMISARLATRKEVIEYEFSNSKKEW